MVALEVLGEGHGALSDPAPANLPMLLLTLRHLRQHPVMLIRIHLNTFLQLAQPAQLARSLRVREEALLLRATGVEGELVHLAVPHHHRDVQGAHLRQLNRFFDQVTHALALQIDALEPIIDLLLAVRLPLLLSLPRCVHNIF